MLVISKNVEEYVVIKNVLTFNKKRHLWKHLTLIIDTYQQIYNKIDLITR